MKVYSITGFWRDVSSSPTVKLNIVADSLSEAIIFLGGEHQSFLVCTAEYIGDVFKIIDGDN